MVYVVKRKALFHKKRGSEYNTIECRAPASSTDPECSVAPPLLLLHADTVMGIIISALKKAHELPA